MKPSGRVARIISNITILFVTLIVVFFIAEISCQIWHKALYLKDFTAKYDPVLGWKGKKIFGDTSARRYKIFVLGDSITDGSGVPEKEMYYNVIKNKLGAEMFIYGGGGYGTLQELLVLDRYYREIKPDLVILQVSANDFINNLWELENRSFFNNNLMIRPYWVDGKIEYRFPRVFGKQRIFLCQHSAFFYFLNNRIDKFYAFLCSRGILHSVEEEIWLKGMALKDFSRSSEITDILIKKMKDIIGDTPLIAFIADNDPNYLKQFRVIFKENSIEFIDNVPEVINELESRGRKLKLRDGWHWNGEGQQICGEILAEKIKQLICVQ